MLSLDKEATAGSQRPHEDDDAVVDIMHSTSIQDHTVSHLDQPGALTNEHLTVSHKMEADTTDDSLQGTRQVKKMHDNSQNGEFLMENGINRADLILLRQDMDDLRPSSATPQYEPSPSDDVSLNLGGGAQEDDTDLGIRRHDDSGVEERRVAFLPPPRV